MSGEAFILDAVRTPFGRATLHSTTLAAAAWDGGFYDPWVVPVPVRDGEHARDEGIRADASVAGLAKLNEAFAAQSLACFGEWKDLDPEKLNVNGLAVVIEA